MAMLGPVKLSERVLRNISVPRIGRFVVIGVLATLTYCALTFFLSLAGLPVAWASMCGFAVSLLVSYFGHAYFTFEVDVSHHKRFGFRFVVVALILTTGCSLSADIVVRKFQIPELYSIVVIAILYPAASFVLHAGWSFVAPEGKRLG